MKLISLAVAGPAILFALAAPQGASAQVVPLAKFRSVELNGGGRVHLRHGPVQRVTFLKGDPRVTRLTVKDNGSQDRLVIDTCRRSCNDYRLELEIVSPNISGVAINNGGQIQTRGGFPVQDSIGVAVRSGGQIDARGLPARNVGAAVSGGGKILTRASGSLSAAVQGGGNITYWGDPSVTTAIQGGGVVEPGS
jgi:hypothetical protein